MAALEKIFLTGDTGAVRAEQILVCSHSLIGGGDRKWASLGMSPPHHLELPVELPKITSLPPTLLYSWEITTAEHQKTEIKLLIRAKLPGDWVHLTLLCDLAVKSIDL